MKSPYDSLDDLRAVAAAYRGERIKGHGGLEAHRAALTVYQERHPEDAAARRRVAELIIAASERAGA